MQGIFCVMLFLMDAIGNHCHLSFGLIHTFGCIVLGCIIVCSKCTKYKFKNGISTVSHSIDIFLKNTLAYCQFNLLNAADGDIA